MSEPISADSCRAISDETARLTCEICRPDDQGHFVISTDKGEFTPETEESCALILPSLIKMGFKLLMQGRTQSPPPRATGQQAAPANRETAAGDQRTAQDGTEPPAEARQEATTDETETADPEGDGRAIGEEIIKPFTARIVTDGRTVKVSRTLLLGKGKGLNLLLEYSALPAEEPGSYILTYSIYKDGAPFEILRSMRFKASEGKANLAFRINASSEDFSGISSINIVDLGR
ncbi:MAG: hypothetical protein JXA24_06900 [Proteobacteria bacterium]|nr:hypothetical protein [Pseudomonadota bacterium]